MFKKFSKSIPKGGIDSFMRAYFKNHKLLEDHEEDSDYMFTITSKTENLQLLLKFPLLNE